MNARARIVTLLVIVGFVAYLLWSTLASQHVECSVAVEFGGQRGTATASGASEEDAIREAQTAAWPAHRLDERPGRVQQGRARIAPLQDHLSAAAPA